MINSGKRKYTKKKVMSGGRIFKLTAFSANGRQNQSNVLVMDGNQVLNFVDKTADTFENTYFKALTFGSSKCYLVIKDGQLYPYQLIRGEDRNVYQYGVYNFDIKRIVEQPATQHSAWYEGTGPYGAA